MSYLLERTVKLHPDAPWLELPVIETSTRSEAEKKRIGFHKLCRELKIGCSTNIYHS